jgi:hypothetical protein
MKLIGKFGQIVTLKYPVAFSDEYGSDGGDYIIGAGRDVVILDARGCRGGRLYIVNGEAEPGRGKHHGREVYGCARIADLERYPDDPARPNPRRAIWSRP